MSFRTKWIGAIQPGQRTRSAARQRTLLVSALLVIGLALTTSCSVQRATTDERASPWEKLARENERRWDALRRGPRRGGWGEPRGRIPQSPRGGPRPAREWRLLGGPGHEYLRLFLTYENSTTEAIKETRVWVNVRDGLGVLRATAWIDIYIPWYEFAPGNTWTGELRVPMRGAHHDPGWSWEVGAAADYGDEYSIGSATLRGVVDVKDVDAAIDAAIARRVAGASEPRR